MPKRSAANPARATPPASPLPPDIERVLAYHRWHDAYDVDALMTYMHLYVCEYKRRRRSRGSNVQTSLDLATLEIDARVRDLRNYLRTAGDADRRAIARAVELGGWFDFMQREAIRLRWASDGRQERDAAILASVEALARESLDLKRATIYRRVGKPAGLSARTVALIVGRAERRRRENRAQS